ncbi:chalcone isomerase family protein [Diaphorobacter aerolatus]|uniref:Chalcone isomerase family protein n=1 Tax=Diaphorobacter aerolatus TaxID=1288495 RepID=A0A7H0GGX0_9BURK|nr:chalcone isomerase family protein [Diaphorobacter aerolatus]QNP47536.1 chalcone isomerase family protein [Diaphorobacter aerolatus]
MLNWARQLTGLAVVGSVFAALSLPAVARTESSATAGETKQASIASQLTESGAYPEKAQVGGRTVQLNGAGTRFKAVFQVYRAALYTEKPIQQYSDLAGNTGAKRIHLVMLRSVNADELGNMFLRGMQENMDKGSSARMMPAMLRMSALFSDYKKLEAGDSIILDWVPGKGTVVSVRGLPAAESMPEAQFYHALAGIWLGAAPADWKLRDAMLGVKATTDTANRN